MRSAGTSRGRPTGRWAAGAAALVTTAACLAGGGTASAAVSVAVSAAAPLAVTAAETGVVPSVDLPTGWSVQASRDGLELAWTSSGRVTIGDAKIEIRAGDQSLGFARAVPGTRRVSVALAGDTAAERTGALRAAVTAGLSVVAAGRRLDVVPASARSTAPGAAAGSVAAAGALPAARPAGAVDPGRPGPYRTVEGQYDLPGLTVTGLPAPVEVRATVVGPRAGQAKLADRAPLVLFLHGRHAPCYQGGPTGEVGGDWPCPAGWQPIPSERGYLDAQRVLASQGYLTVSIAANGINGQDWQLPDGGAGVRSELVRHHLALWAQWSAGKGKAPGAVRSLPRADVARVLLVGHSRGGEGVNRVALDSTAPAGTASSGGRSAPWTLAGLVLIGPTAFGDNPAPGVPSVTLLPACDGDVFDLQGQQYVDSGRDLGGSVTAAGTDRALRSAVMVMGANHNFFNSEWTPGVAVAPAADDWGDDADPTCGTGSGRRLTPTAQRTVGTAYVAAAARVLVAGDDAALPLLDGSNVGMRSAGDARVLVHALGERRRAALVPDDRVAVKPSGTGVQARVCRALDSDALPGPCLDPEFAAQSPHFLSPWLVLDDRYPVRRAVDLRWTASGGSAALRPVGGTSLTGASHLDLRVVVPPREMVRFGVRLVDRGGRALVLADVQLTGLPGGQAQKFWAQEARLALDAAAVKRAGLDLAHLAGVDLLPRSTSGRVWLLDAWSWRAGPEPGDHPARAARVDVGQLKVAEGSTTHTVAVPIRVHRVKGAPRGPVKLWVNVTQADGSAPATTVVDVPGGADRVDVPVTVAGNAIWDGENRVMAVTVKPISGATAGDWVGTLTVTEDDPAPVARVTAVTPDVTEGGSLVYRATVTGATSVPVAVPLTFLPPPAGATELTTADLDPTWVENYLGLPPDPTQPPLTLSQVSELLGGGGAAIIVEPGTSSADLTIPTVNDGVTEPVESLLMGLPSWSGPIPGIDPGLRLTGTVRDA